MQKLNIFHTDTKIWLDILLLWCIMALLNTHKLCPRLFAILALIKEPVKLNQSTTYHKAFGSSNSITSRAETSTPILLTVFLTFTLWDKLIPETVMQKS